MFREDRAVRGLLEEVGLVLVIASSGGAVGRGVADSLGSSVVAPFAFEVATASPAQSSPVMDRHSDTR